MKLDGLVALASGGLENARMNANESAAIATLKNISSAQAQCQASGVIDANGNGAGEYGFFAELAGSAPVRGSSQRISPPVLSSAFGKVADKIVEQSGTRPLSWLVGGYRHITNSKRPITKIGDLQGLKIRVPPVAVQLDSFKAWGVEPHPLAWAETFNALQQGVIDGQENPYTVIRDQKFWEVQKYVTELPYMLWVGPMLVSENWYKRLDADTKALVNKAAKEAAAHEWKWAAEQDGVAKKQCLDKGMVLGTLTDAPVWQEKARSIWPKFYDQVGGKAMLDEALAISAGK